MYNDIYFLIIFIFIIYIKYNKEYKLDNIYLEILYKIGIIIIISLLFVYIRKKKVDSYNGGNINKDILNNIFILMKKIKNKIIINNNELNNLNIELKLINKIEIVYNDSINKILLRKKCLINNNKKLILLLKNIFKKYNRICKFGGVTNKEQLEVFDDDFIKEELKNLQEQEHKILNKFNGDKDLSSDDISESEKLLSDDISESEKLLSDDISESDESDDISESDDIVDLVSLRSI